MHVSLTAATTKQIWWFFVVVVCLALLLKGTASKVIQEMAWVKRNMYSELRKKIPEESTWQSKNETQWN